MFLRALNINNCSLNVYPYLRKYYLYSKETILFCKKIKGPLLFNLFTIYPSSLIKIPINTLVYKSNKKEAEKEESEKSKDSVCLRDVQLKVKLYTLPLFRSKPYLDLNS